MGSVFVPSVAGAVAVLACFWGWVAFEVWVNLKTWQAGSMNRDRLSRYLIIGAVGVAVNLAMAATMVHALDMTTRRAEVFYLGITLMLVGLLFRWVAIRQLGQFFVPEVTIQPGQRVIDAGLYRYLRHPSYTGILLTLVGFGFALTNFLSLLLLLGISSPALAYRIRQEEAVLLEAFGEEYRRYMVRTKRLIPFLFLLPR